MTQNENPGFTSTENKFATLGILLALTFGFLAVLTTNRNFSEVPERLNALGAAYAYSVWQGEVWRFFSAIFLHDSILVYLINSFFLVRLGQILEQLCGAPRFILLFLISGAFGFAINVLIGGQVYFGSAAALFGVIGGLLGAHFCLHDFKIDLKLLNLIILFTCFHFFSVLTENGSTIFLFSNVVFASAFLLGLLVGFSYFAENSKLHKWATPTLSFGLIMFFVAIAFSVRPQFLPRFHEAMAVNALKLKDYPRAQEHGNWLIKNAKTKSAGPIISARVLANLGEDAHALALAEGAFSMESSPEHFWKAATFRTEQSAQPGGVFLDEKGSALLCRVLIKKGVKEASIVNDCSWLYLVALRREVRDPKQALELALAMTKTTENVSVQMLRTLAEAYFQNGYMAESLHVVERALIKSNKAEIMDFMSLKNRIEQGIAQAD